MIDPAVLDALLKAGASAEMIVEATKAAILADLARQQETREALSVETARKRSYMAERKRAQRQREAEALGAELTSPMSNDVKLCQVDIDGQSLTIVDAPFPPKEIPHTPKEITPLPDLFVGDAGVSERVAPAPVASDRKAAFVRFWAKWPNKVSKVEAERAFGKVWAEIDAILVGVDRYIAEKPADRPWLHASTFLNNRRWEDVPAPFGPPPPRAGPNGSRLRTNLELDVILESIADERAGKKYDTSLF